MGTLRTSTTTWAILIAIVVALVGYIYVFKAVDTQEEVKNWKVDSEVKNWKVDSGESTDHKESLYTKDKTTNEQIDFGQLRVLVVMPLQRDEATAVAANSFYETFFSSSNSSKHIEYLSIQADPSVTSPTKKDGRLLVPRDQVNGDAPAGYFMRQTVGYLADISNSYDYFVLIEPNTFLCPNRLLRTITKQQLTTAKTDYVYGGVEVECMKPFPRRSSDHDVMFFKDTSGRFKCWPKFMHGMAIVLSQPLLTLLTRGFSIFNVYDHAAGQLGMWMMGWQTTKLRLTTVPDAMGNAIPTSCQCASREAIQGGFEVFNDCNPKLFSNYYQRMQVAEIPC